MVKYKGPERRSGKEFQFSLSDANYRANVRRETYLVFYSDPHWYAWLGHAKEDDNDRHFIPLRDKEPKNIRPSGCLTLPSMGGLARNALGVVDNTYMDMWMSYDIENEKYSREVFPDRRAPKSVA